MSLTVEARHQLGQFVLDAAFTSDGGVTALFGRSGSGKTSLINIIAGLLKPQSGRIVLDGDVIADSERRIFTPVHRRRFGYVFQEARLFPHLSVGHNLAYGRWFAGGFFHLVEPRCEPADVVAVVSERIRPAIRRNAASTGVAWP